MKEAIGLARADITQGKPKLGRWQIASAQQEPNLSGWMPPAEPPKKKIIPDPVTHVDHAFD